MLGRGIGSCPRAATPSVDNSAREAQTLKRLSMRPRVRISRRCGTSGSRHAARDVYWNMRVSRVARPPFLSEHLAHDDHVFFPAKPLLDALDATSVDGATRRVSIGTGPGNELNVMVRRGSDGTLMLGLSESLDDQSEPLRLLARQMVGEADTAVLLQILCEVGARQCKATSAGVLRTVVNEGELVSAMGPLDVARGKRFALSGSLAREVIRTRDVVAVDDFSGSLRP